MYLRPGSELSTRSRLTASYRGCLDSLERGTVEWNSGTVEWNSGMGNYD